MKNNPIIFLVLFSFLLGCVSYKRSAEEYQRLPIKNLSKTSEKMGESCGSYFFLYPIFFNMNYESVIERARVAGKIEDIVSIERKNTFGIALPFFLNVRSCIIVRGN